MNIYITKWFGRWARKEGVSENSLCDAVAEMEKGLTDANLGGNLFKKRIAMTGRGKSGSFRTLVAYKSGDRSFFVYGFAKNVKDDIGDDEKHALKALAKELLELDAPRIKRAIKAKELRKLECGDG
ncbi:MAG: type II toxin-antitoxin system RelE/ParE family toxin [Nitrospinota bacterium]|nr:type II toxin-antitoxin system RelE/ParE family toxin [Nitrospinota bacterium]